jgi:hypothetical protein
VRVVDSISTTNKNALASLHMARTKSRVASRPKLQWRPQPVLVKRKHKRIVCPHVKEFKIRACTCSVCGSTKCWALCFDKSTGTCYSCVRATSK